MIPFREVLLVFGKMSIRDNLLRLSPLQQLTVTEVKVDKVQVSGVKNTTFAVCLDQDEKKILQSVTRFGMKINTCTQIKRNRKEAICDGS